MKDNDPDYQPYLRDPKTLVRSWALPGQQGLRHHIGGLEKADITGEISYDPYNHEKMTNIRAEKIDRVANHIPLQQVMGEEEGDLLVVGWGGTYGALYTAVMELQEEWEKHQSGPVQLHQSLALQCSRYFRQIQENYCL